MSDLSLNPSFTPRPGPIKAYLVGAITHANAAGDASALGIRRALIDGLDQQGVDVHCPSDFTGLGSPHTPDEVYRQDYRACTRSDLIVISASATSIGSGQEVELSAGACLSRLAIVPASESAGPLFRGLFSRLEWLQIDNTADLPATLRNRLGSLLIAVNVQRRRRRYLLDQIATWCLGDQLLALRALRGKSVAAVAESTGISAWLIRDAESDSSEVAFWPLGRLLRVLDALGGQLVSDESRSPFGGMKIVPVEGHLPEWSAAMQFAKQSHAFLDSKGLSEPNDPLRRYGSRPVVEFEKNRTKRGALRRNLRVYLDYPMSSIEGATEHTKTWVRQAVDEIRSALSDCGMEVYDPLAEDPQRLGLDGSAVYRAEFEAICNCDAIVCVVHPPAMGVGIAAQIACNCGIPRMTIAYAGGPVTRMYEGMPAPSLGRIDVESPTDLKRRVVRYCSAGRERIAGIAESRELFRERARAARLGSSVFACRFLPTLQARSDDALSSQIESATGLRREWLEHIEAFPGAAELVTILQLACVASVTTSKIAVSASGVPCLARVGRVWSEAELEVAANLSSALASARGYPSIVGAMQLWREWCDELVEPVSEYLEARSRRDEGDGDRQSRVREFIQSRGKLWTTDDWRRRMAGKQ